jgi:hypothetical protein
VAADFSEISFRTIGIGACSDRVDPGVCRTYGHDSHSYVLVVVALVALLMAWGAVVGRSRAAAIAVAALGVVVLFIALAVDLPKLDDKRGLDVRYNDVAAHTGTAFRLELVGGVLLLLAGGLALARAGSGDEPWQPRRRRRPPRAEGSSEPGDGEGLSGAEARARERARRRAARRDEETAGPTDPPDPGTAAQPGPGADVVPEAGAVEPPEPPPAPPPPGAPEESEPVAPAPEEGELGPDAYRPPDAEPDPPARG